MKLGVEVFWRKIMSRTGSPAEEPIAARTLEPVSGPRPMRPEFGGWLLFGVVWTDEEVRECVGSAWGEEAMTY